MAVGGTSLSCSDVGRTDLDRRPRAGLGGVPSLDGATQTLPMLYNLPSSDFHDITTGSNGFSATTGYDLVTGLGTPVANLLVPDMVARSPLVSGPSTASVNYQQLAQFLYRQRQCDQRDGWVCRQQSRATDAERQRRQPDAGLGLGRHGDQRRQRSASMTIQGTLTQLNNALNGLVYTPKSGYSGTDSLVLSYVDTRRRRRSDGIGHRRLDRQCLVQPGSGDHQREHAPRSPSGPRGASP